MKDCDIVELTQMAVNIFHHEHILFSSNEAHIFHKIDRSQWVRVITNLVQNALQSIPKNKTPQIGVQLLSENDQTIMKIENGLGLIIILHILPPLHQYFHTATQMAPGIYLKWYLRAMNSEHRRRTQNRMLFFYCMKFKTMLLIIMIRLHLGSG